MAMKRYKSLMMCGLHGTSPLGDGFDTKTCGSSFLIRHSLMSLPADPSPFRVLISFQPNHLFLFPALIFILQVARKHVTLKPHISVSRIMRQSLIVIIIIIIIIPSDIFVMNIIIVTVIISSLSNHFHLVLVLPIILVVVKAIVNYPTLMIPG